MSSSRAKRALRAREPKLVEGDRVLLGVRGPATSGVGLTALRTLLRLKRGDSRMLTRKNDIRPFEDGSSLEFLTERNGCSAFAFISHTKKRPHNLVLGRTFDRHTLDQIELAVDRVVVSGSEEGAKSSGSADGAPMFIFKGDAWSRQPELATLQSMILDVFGARAVTTVTLKHLDHVTMVTALEREEGGGAYPPPVALMFSGMAPCTGAPTLSSWRWPPGGCPGWSWNPASLPLTFLCAGHRLPHSH